MSTPNKPLWTALALVCAAPGCVPDDHPLSQSGSARFLLDQQPIYAADLLDETGTPLLPRQSPFDKLVRLQLTQDGAPEHGAYVDVLLDPPEVLALTPSEDGTCYQESGIFRCRAEEDGYASFHVTSVSDWSGTAELSLVGRNETTTIVVSPAGLPDEATTFTMVIEGLDAAKVPARYTALSCTLEPVPDETFSKWPAGATRVREAEIRVTPPAGSPGVVEHAPVIVESLSPEVFVTLDASCGEPRTSRVRVQLDALGRSPKFYFCFSDVGGNNIQLAFSSGVKIGEPRVLDVEPEPRLLRVVTLDETIDVFGGEVAAVALSAFDSDLNKVPLTVDIRSSDTGIISLSSATTTLPVEGEDSRLVFVTPVADGTATIDVSPELFDEPTCSSLPITVFTP